jgi:hypothetical protein
VAAVEKRKASEMETLDARMRAMFAKKDEQISALREAGQAKDLKVPSRHGRICVLSYVKRVGPMHTTDAVFFV